jgi:hypothetical protein
MLGAVKTEDLTDIVETMCRRFMSMPVFQGGRINGAWQLLLLQGEAVVSICTEFIQNDGSLSLLRNRLLKGGDESDGRQKQECEPEAFDKLEGKPGKSFPGEVFAAAMDSLYAASLPWINASSAAGFPQPDSKTAPHPLPPGKLPRAGTIPKYVGLNLRKRSKRAQFMHIISKME